MAIKLEEYDHVCVFSVDGDLAGETVNHLRRVAQARIEQRRVVDFVVDLEKSHCVDSEGLEALLWLKRQSEELFGKVRLASLDDSYKKILEITRLESRFECHATLPLALKSMR